jgi:hypothetical protein
MKINKSLLILVIILISVYLTAIFISQAAAQSGGPENPLKFNTIGELINQIADFIIIVALPIATIMIIYAAFLFITAGSSEEKVKKARTVIILAVVGIAILLVAKGAALIIQDVLGVNPSSTSSPSPTISLSPAISPSPTISAAPLSIISNESLPNGIANQDYPSQAIQVEGGKPAYTWNVANGSLPPGLNMNSSGIISGRPNENGNYNFVVKVADSLRNLVSKNFQLTVNSSPNASKCVTIDGSGSIGIELIAHDPDSKDSASGCSTEWSLQSFLAGDERKEWIAFADSLKPVLHKFPPITAARWTLYRSDAFGESSCSSVSEKVYVVPCGEEFRAFALMGDHEVHLSLSGYSSTYTALAHELGHSFASLNDEYPESGKNPIPYGAGNCVQNSCPVDWGPGNCFDGCNYQSAGKGWYRDAPKDLMYSVVENNQYGPIDQKIIRALLSK